MRTKAVSYQDVQPWTNILVLQETIHSFKRLKGRKGYMILKLDLEKAYDRLEWSFVMDML